VTRPWQPASLRCALSGEARCGPLSYKEPNRTLRDLPIITDVTRMTPTLDYLGSMSRPGGHPSSYLLAQVTPRLWVAPSHQRHLLNPSEEAHTWTLRVCALTHADCNRHGHNYLLTVPIMSVPGERVSRHDIRKHAKMPGFLPARGKWSWSGRSFALWRWRAACPCRSSGGRHDGDHRRCGRSTGTSRASGIDQRTVEGPGQTRGDRQPHHGRRGAGPDK
jgi:hypothetical protein